jgi:DNA topoisomerase-1
VEELFQYVDESGVHRVVESGHVNEYLRSITGEGISAKDFRTWGGTMLAAELLRELGPAHRVRDKESKHREGGRSGRRAAWQHTNGLS